jgi:hypothetical protein
LDVATNWSAWDTMRRLNGMSTEDSKRVMERAVLALLDSTHNQTGLKEVDMDAQDSEA